MKRLQLTSMSILFISLVLIIFPFVADAQSASGEFYITVVSPNGQMLAGASTSGLFRIWDAQTGATLFDLNNSGTPLPLSVAWAPDSNRIATAGGDSTIRVWCTDMNASPQCTDGILLHEMTGHEDPITAIAWSSDNLLASGGQIETWTVRIWDMSTYQQVNQAQLGLVRQLAWSPNGDYLAKVNDGYEVFVVDSALTRPIDYLASRINDFSILAYSVAWSDDSTKIAYGTIDGEIHVVEIVDSTTRNEIKVLQGHVGKIYALAWNPDNIQLASSGADGTTRIWNTITGASTVLQSPKTIAVNLQIAWGTNGSTLYYADGDANPVGLPTPIASNTPTSGPSSTPTRTPTATATSSSYACPCSLWTTSDTPSVLDSGNSAAVEVGVKFKSSVTGTITGLRFYKASVNTGTHVGHLWTASGTLLATATFTGESASGWQTVTFGTPVNISGNTTYVASYHTTSGHFSYDANYFTNAWVNGPLTALDDASSGGNGVYTIGPSGSFPTTSGSSPNLWVDVIFTTSAATATPTNTPTQTPTPTVTPTSGSFPTTSVLDNFNRANGGVGSNWSGQLGGYSISSNQMLVAAGSDNPLYWNPTSYAADQEAYVKLVNINTSADEIDLTLKMQGSTWSDGILEVLYNPAGNKVQIYTYTSSQDWIQRGTDISVTFAAGDVFGAKAKADGTVEVYKNGTLVGSRSVTAWPYYANGGKIGLWMINAGGTVLDDFGGGNS